MAKAAKPKSPAASDKPKRDEPAPAASVKAAKPKPHSRRPTIPLSTP